MPMVLKNGGHYSLMKRTHTEGIKRILLCVPVPIICWGQLVQRLFFVVKLHLKRNWKTKILLYDYITSQCTDGTTSSWLAELGIIVNPKNKMLIEYFFCLFLSEWWLMWIPCLDTEENSLVTKQMTSVWTQLCFIRKICFNRRQLMTVMPIAAW